MSSSNQNRKLTPSKQLSIRANSGIQQNPQSVNYPRNYEKRPKMNGRSNTIEIVQQPDQARKNGKGKERGGMDDQSPALLGVGLGHTG